MKDKFSDVRGQEIVFVWMLPKVKFKVTCFVAGIDKTTIHLHPKDERRFIKSLAKAYKVKYSIVERTWQPPQNYAFCAVNKRAYNILLKALRKKQKSICGSALECITEDGRSVDCPL
jgi:hypothetical protein